MKRHIFIILGFALAFAAILGIFVPVLPTVPLLLAASLCFSKGSERFDTWFKSTTVYRKHIGEYHRRGGMTLAAKLRIMTLVTVILVVSGIMADNLYIRIFFGVVAAAHYYAFIFKIKTVPKQKNLPNKACNVTKSDV